MFRSRKAKKEKEEVVVVEEVVVEDLDADEQLALLSRRRSVETDSARESSKGNRVYQTIKREIDLREKTRPEDIPACDQVFFVDKQRNAAVVIGQTDLKTDVKKKKKARSENTDTDLTSSLTGCNSRAEGERDPDEPDPSIMVTQAIHELK